MIKETKNDTWVVGYMLKARTFISKKQPHKQKNRNFNTHTQNNSQDIDRDRDIELCIKIHTLLPFQQ